MMTENVQIPIDVLRTVQSTSDGDLSRRRGGREMEVWEKKREGRCGRSGRELQR